MSAKERGRIFARAEYPLYTVAALDIQHFLVAGGGGQAKTGVANAIEIYELRNRDGSCTCSSVHREDTGTAAVMNTASFSDGRNHVLAAGLDDICQLYALKYRVTTPQKATEEHNKTKLRNADSSKTESGNSGDENTIDSTKTYTSTSETVKVVSFECEMLEKVQTDFASEGGFQKVVRFSLDHSFFATGGVDGVLRVWQYPDVKKLHEIESHSSHIDDLDISPDGKHIVTVSRDNTSSVWDVATEKLVTSLKWSVKQSEPYRCRLCRYGIVENNRSRFNLYTINIPCKRSSKPSSCYLTLWDAAKFCVRKNTRTGTEILSAMAVNDDGSYIGIGTISGSVAVYIAFSLQCLYSVRSIHNYFVTGLAFMPPSEAEVTVGSDHDFSLISISADNTIRHHQMVPRALFSMWWAILGFVVIICAIFWVLVEFGL